MERLRKALITQGTSVIYPQFNEQGKLGAMVLQNGELIYMDISPTKLVDYSIRCYGSSLRGAIDGTRLILGDISMPPVVVSEKLGLYWFPSKSPASYDCVWLSAGHVDRFTPVGKEHTKVIFTNGSSMILNCSNYSFEKKHQRACWLKKQMEGWTSRAVICEKESSYMIRLSPCKRNYEVLED